MGLILGYLLILILNVFIAVLFGLISIISLHYVFIARNVTMPLTNVYLTIYFSITAKIA